jgi:hypothetical protein
MIFEKFGIEIARISYEIEMAEEKNRRLALITPVLDITSSAGRVLVACLKVDGHELLPSAKIEVREGGNKVRLHEVRIFNPLLSRHADPENIRQYKMTLKFPPKTEFFRTSTVTSP